MSRAHPGQRPSKSHRSAAVLVWLLCAGCGSAGSARGNGNGEEVSFQADERAYLAFRREERSCETLRMAAETELANQNHAGALDASELVMAFCPSSQLDAIENTMVIVNRTEAVPARSPTRSVRVRLALPLPPGDRLLWFGAYADRKLGLNNLTIGPHRIDVEMHLWRTQADREGQLLRVNGAADVRIDGRMPVWLDVVLNRPDLPAMPPALLVRPASSHLPPGASARGSPVEMSRLAALRDEMPTIRSPASLDRAGIPATIDLELCFDAAGQLRRVDPLGWPHPRQLGVYLDGLRDWRLRTPGTSWLCTGWRQVTTAATRTRFPTRE
jgi:hypothetical protein